MRRLAPLDKALVLILVPLWVVCFTLSVRTQVRGGGWLAGVGLSVEDSESYPALSGQFSRLINSSDPLAEAGLRAGDRLIRLGDADLRGLGTLGFTAHSIEQGRRGLRLPLIFERDGKRLETSLRTAPVSLNLPMMPVSFAFAVSALFLLLRGRPTPMVRAYFYYAMCQAIAPGFTAGSRPEYYAWFGMFVVSN
ncbi:MAG: hypothetical protein O7A09_12790, partial [Proteobacteria bacterium]|nr:hypothetical protein [Pseudomonadota bacterium]